MSIALPDEPRKQWASQKAKLNWKQRARLVDKKALLPKTVDERGYTRVGATRRSVTDEMHTISNRLVGEFCQSGFVESQKDSDLKVGSEEAEVSRQRAKFAQFYSDLHRAFVLEITKPLEETREKLEKTIQQTITIPKIDLVSPYLEKIQELQRLQEGRFEQLRVFSTEPFKALATATNFERYFTSAFSDITRSISAVDKFHEVFVRQQEQNRLVFARLLALSSQVLIESVRKQLLIVEQNAAEVKIPFNALLQDLRNGLGSANATAIDAVLQIQTQPIPSDSSIETTQLLVSFIEKHRNTNSQKVLIAVGAAIRKVLLNIADEQLGLAAELMKSAGSLEVPIEVELEVAKMVVHRFRYAPNTSTEGLSDLADLLLDNAKDYSKAKLVNREYYGATALNSVLSIVLMRHKEASALIEHIEAVSADWFVELVKNRLRRIAKEIEKERLEGSVDVVELMRTLATKAVGKRSAQGDH
jgi:hypothetical protein